MRSFPSLPKPEPGHPGRLRRCGCIVLPTGLRRRLCALFPLCRHVRGPSQGSAGQAAERIGTARTKNDLRLNPSHRSRSGYFLCLCDPPLRQGKFRNLLQRHASNALYIRPSKDFPDDGIMGNNLGDWAMYGVFNLFCTRLGGRAEDDRGCPRPPASEAAHHLHLSSAQHSGTKRSGNPGLYSK